MSAMLASAPHGSPASNSSAARIRMRSAASSDTCARAIGNAIPWLRPIGRPKISRSRARAVERSMNHRPLPMHSAAMRMRSAFMPSRT
jgi:hypothetical protein